MSARSHNVAIQKLVHDAKEIHVSRICAANKVARLCMIQRSSAAACNDTVNSVGHLGDPKIIPESTVDANDAGIQCTQ